MKYIKVIFLIIFIMSGEKLFSQQIMYVTAKEGLNKREEPSIYSKKVGQFLFGEMVVISEQGEETTIDGIKSYWYRIHEKISVNGELVAPWDKYCWVFGGYLSEELPLDAPVIIGRWKYNEDDYLFFANREYSFAQKGYHPPVGGRWDLNGSTITITRNNGNVLTAKITIIDRNNIILKFSNDEWRLTRKNTQ
jgi:hypothetical protein